MIHRTTRTLQVLIFLGILVLATRGDWAVTSGSNAPRIGMLGTIVQVEGIFSAPSSWSLDPNITTLPSMAGFPSESRNLIFPGAAVPLSSPRIDVSFSNNVIRFSGGGANSNRTRTDSLLFSLDGVSYTLMSTNKWQQLDVFSAVTTPRTWNTFAPEVVDDSGVVFFRGALRSLVSSPSIPLIKLNASLSPPNAAEVFGVYDESGEGFGRVELFSSEWPTNQSDTLTYTFCNGSAFNASGSQISLAGVRYLSDNSSYTLISPSNRWQHHRTYCPLSGAKLVQDKIAICYLRGMLELNQSSSASFSSLLAVLPSHLRPSTTLILNVVCSRPGSCLCQIKIFPNGNISLLNSQSSVTEVSLSGISYQVPVDCVLSEWSVWTQGCMANRNTRNRTVLLAPSDDGIQCDVLEENRLCLSLIDTSQDTTPSCELSEWGSCDAACDGIGMKRRLACQNETAPCTGSPCFDGTFVLIVLVAGVAAVILAACALVVFYWFMNRSNRPETPLSKSSSRLALVYEAPLNPEVVHHDLRCYLDPERVKAELGWQKKGRIFIKELVPGTEDYARFYEMMLKLDGQQIFKALHNANKPPTVHAIFNPTIVNHFLANRHILATRFANDPDTFKNQNWMKDKNKKRVALRQAFANEYFAKMASYSWNTIIDPVPIIPAIHGTAAATAWKIANTGFSALSALDLGFFGCGMYFTSSALYALPYYGTRKKPAILISLVYPGNPLPVVYGPRHKKSLKGVTVRPGYQCHYALTSSDGAPLKKMSRKKEFYDEIVIGQEAQIVPIYLVELDPNPLESLVLRFQRTIPAESEDYTADGSFAAPPPGLPIQHRSSPSPAPPAPPPSPIITRPVKSVPKPSHEAGHLVESLSESSLSYEVSDMASSTEAIDMPLKSNRARSRSSSERITSSLRKDKMDVSESEDDSIIISSDEETV